MRAAQALALSSTASTRVRSGPKEVFVQFVSPEKVAVRGKPFLEENSRTGSIQSADCSAAAYVSHESELARRSRVRMIGTLASPGVSRKIWSNSILTTSRLDVSADAPWRHSRSYVLS